MKDHAVLFDMNGVIVDDELLHEEAFRKVLLPLDIELSHDQYLEFFAGRTDHDGFVALSSAKDVVLDLPKLMGEKAAAYLELARGGIKGYPGVFESTQALSRAGFRLVVVTSSLRVEADTILESLDVAEFFEFVLSAEDVSKGKPDPEEYVLASKKLGVGPDHCVVIEDAPSGVAAAKAAGMLCLAVTNTHSANDLVGVDLVVDQLDDSTVKNVRSLLALE